MKELSYNEVQQVSGGFIITSTIFVGGFGLCSVGGLALGGLVTGGLAVGGLALGGLAVGGLAVGGLAIGATAAVGVTAAIGVTAAVGATAVVGAGWAATSAVGWVIGQCVKPTTPQCVIS